MGINRNKVLAAARKQVRKGNWEKAIGKYQELVDDDPSDARSLLKVADLYSKIDRREEALDAYQAVASHYAGDDIYEKAVAVYKQALRLAPDEPALHRDLGDCYHRLGRLKDAVRSYHKAQKIFKKAGNPAAQRELLERMIRLDPDDVGMRIQLAERYAKDDLQDDALELFEFAADKLDEEGRIDEFVQVAERIIFLRGDAVSLRRRVIDIYLRRGDNKHALKHLQVCFKKCPQDSQILELLVEAFRRLARYDKAVLVMHELVNLYRTEGRTDEIARTYEQILELAPQDTRAKKGLHKMRRLDDSGAMTGQRRDTGPMDQRPATGRKNTPAEPQEVEADALDGIEFLDDDSADDLEVVEVQEPSANQPVASQSPPPESHNQQRRHPQPSSPAGAGSGGRHDGSAPAEDDGLADISGQIEVIEAVEPTEEHGPDTSEEVVAELLKETDVFIKYGLHDKAYETIVGVIAKHPDSLQAREQMRKLQEARGNIEGAVDELLEMARITRTTPGRAHAFLDEALELADDPERILEAADSYGLSLDSVGDEEALDEISVVEFDVIDELDELEDVELDQVADSHVDDAADELLELDMGDLEFVDAEPDEVDPDEFEEHFHEVEESVVQISEVELDDADLEILDEDTDAEMIEVAEDDGLDFDESDFDNADDIVDMDVDIDGLGELSGEQMVGLEDADDDEPEGGLDLYLTEDEADEMFDDLFGDFDNTAEKVNLGGDDPLGELAEVDFFIQQGLVDEAQEVLDRVRADQPDHPGISKRARQIDQARQGLQPEDNPFGARSLSQKFRPDAEDEDSQPNNVIDLGDASAHNTSIELGTAYRDMGLFNEAIEEFKHALDDPDAAPAATFHIALCEIEKGATDAATSRLQSLLDQDALTDRLRQAAREKLEEISA
ncbi:MAG: tetratricopeptide repeat protein [Persicimonas sp.]